MIEGYLSIKEAAEKWGITPRRVQVLCSSGRIEGAGFIKQADTKGQVYRVTDAGYKYRDENLVAQVL